MLGEEPHAGARSWGRGRPAVASGQESHAVRGLAEDVSTPGAAATLGFQRLVDPSPELLLLEELLEGADAGEEPVGEWLDRGRVRCFRAQPGRHHEHTARQGPG